MNDVQQLPDQRLVWPERLARVRRSRLRADLTGMFRPPRDPVERRFLQEHGLSGDFPEDPNLPPPSVVRRRRVTE
jgi:hypothetical protein